MNNNNIESLNDLNGIINNDILEKLRLKHKNSGDENYLTELQQKVFSNDDFWENSKNIIIRGQTSSGKTMIAEIASAWFGAKEYLDMPNEQNNIIYLVPLRAMVAEKRTEFKDIFEESLGWRVYASSSDYQDHDEDIVEGRFKIAIMVYEKFFALLAQNNSFVSSCSLIIVDELQMLGVEDRGAKLEIALTKIGIVNPTCKIIGLTTLQCDTLFVRAWLNAAEIECDQRPKALHEYIVWPDREKSDDGENIEKQSDLKFYYYVRCEKSAEKKLEGEGDSNGKNNLDHDEPKVLDNTPIMIDFKRNHFERLLVPNLVESILKKKEENKTIKMLIFVNNKKGVEEVAKQLAEYLSKNRRARKNIDLQNDERMVNLYDSEENIDIFLDKILPYGVAYHHGGLSRSMRDFVEEEFRKSEGYINIVVATETLAIGVNMPADVVILAGVNLPRGGNRKNIMNSSEYKNCIGRAGRLGIEASECGESYLIATSKSQANDYWEKYIKAKPIKIMSYMLKFSDIQKAPYMLNLVQYAAVKTAGGLIKIEDYEKNANKIFYHYCIDENRKRVIQGEKIQYSEKLSPMYREQIEVLESANMLTIFPGNMFEISTFGENLARYALSIGTLTLIDNIIRRYIIQTDGRTKELLSKSIDEGVSDDFQGREEKHYLRRYFDKYFLDILFDLCTCDEANKDLDENTDNSYVDKAIAYLMKNRSMLMADGSLMRILEKYESEYMELPNQRKGKALEKAILLYEWSQGTEVRIIRKKTGLSYVNAGDLDRLADVVAYLWEAMACGFRRSVSKRHTMNLAKKSGIIKYGVPQDIVLLASRKVPYLSRNQLMRLRKEAEENHMDPISYARNMRNIEKTYIPKNIFKRLSKELQLYYNDDGLIYDNEYLKKKELIDDDCKKILDDYEEEQQLNSKQIMRLLTKKLNDISIETCIDHAKIETEREEIRVYPISKDTSIDWINSVCNRLENAKKDTSKTIIPVFLINNPITDLANISQISYEAFVRLYRYGLKKAGHIRTILDVLRSGCDLVDVKLAEKVIDEYGNSTDKDLAGEVRTYLKNQDLPESIVIDNKGDKGMNVNFNNSTVYTPKMIENNYYTNDSKLYDFSELRNIIDKNCEDKVKSELHNEIKKMEDEISKGILKKDDKDKWLERIKSVAQIGAHAVTISNASWLQGFLLKIEEIFSNLP